MQVSELLEHMTPSNVRLDLQTSNFSTEIYPKTQREPWFDVPHITKPIPEPLLEQWASQSPGSDLALPPKNNFIPTDFTLRCDETATASSSQPASNKSSTTRQTSKQASHNGLAGQKHSHNGSLTNGSSAQQTAVDSTASDAPTHATPPDLLCNEAGLRAWHKLDCQFQTPKAAAYFCLTSAAMYKSPEAAAVTHLLVKVLEDTLCETAYLADVAGLSYDVSCFALPVCSSCLTLSRRTALCCVSVCCPLSCMHSHMRPGALPKGNDHHLNCHNHLCWAHGW